MRSVFQELSHIFMDLLETLVMAVAIFIVVYMFLLQPHQVRGQSMTPNFEDGEFILTDKITYRFRQPERGDVVVFRAPQDPDYDFIKRVVGLSGERLKIYAGHFYIYNPQHPRGDKIIEPYISPSLNTPTGSLLKEGEIITVPDNQYFVTGDNRGHSSDSREWGTVPRESVIGRAWLRYWPPPKIGLIPQIDYQF